MTKPRYHVTPATPSTLTPVIDDCRLRCRLAVGVPVDGHVQRFAGHVFSDGVMNDRCSRCGLSVSTVLSDETACGFRAMPAADDDLAQIRTVKEEFMAAITGVSRPRPETLAEPVAEAESC